MRSPANARKPLRTDGRTDRRTDGHAVKRLRLVGWTNGPMYRSKEGISGFGRTDGRMDGRTDGQPENIMPPAPKGGGIKTSKLCITSLYERNTPVTGVFPSQRSSNTENVSIWWHHHDKPLPELMKTKPTIPYGFNEFHWFFNWSFPASDDIKWFLSVPWNKE